MVIIGDVHGALSEIPYMMKKHGIYGRSIVQVGDLGLGFYSHKDDIKNLKALNETMEEHRCTFYAIRGNHDYPLFFDGTLDLFSAIKLISDNSLLEIDGKQVYFCGGGISIDRLARIAGINYWKNEEVLIDEEKLKGIEAVDIVVTHVAPSHVYPRGYNSMVEAWIEAERKKGNDLRRELEDERSQIDKIYTELRDKGLKEWYYGHYHKNNSEEFMGIRYTCIDILCMYDTTKGDYITGFKDFDTE